MPRKDHTASMSKIRKLSALTQIYKGSTLPGVKADAKEVAKELRKAKAQAKQKGWNKSANRAAEQGRKAGRGGRIPR